MGPVSLSSPAHIASRDTSAGSSATTSGDTRSLRTQHASLWASLGLRSSPSGSLASDRPSRSADSLMQSLLSEASAEDCHCFH